MADICFIIILLIFGFSGYKRGFVRSILGMASTLLSLLLSILLVNPISQLLLESSLGNRVREFLLSKATTESPIVLETAIQSATSVFIKIIAFIAALILIKIVVKFITKVLNIAAKLPLIKQANSILGALIGVLVGVIVSYIIVGCISAFIAEDVFLGFSEIISNSKIAYFLYKDNLVAEVLSEIK